MKNLNVWQNISNWQNIGFGFNFRSIFPLVQKFGTHRVASGSGCFACHVFYILCFAHILCFTTTHQIPQITSLVFGAKKSHIKDNTCVHSSEGSGFSNIMGIGLTKFAKTHIFSFCWLSCIVKGYILKIWNNKIYSESLPQEILIILCFMIILPLFHKNVGKRGERSQIWFKILDTFVNFENILILKRTPNGIATWHF